jgi:hypothetical protein
MNDDRFRVISRHSQAKRNANALKGNIFLSLVGVSENLFFFICARVGGGCRPRFVSCYGESVRASVSAMIVSKNSSSGAAIIFVAIFLQHIFPIGF